MTKKGKIIGFLECAQPENCLQKSYLKVSYEEISYIDKKIKDQNLFSQHISFTSLRLGILQQIKGYASSGLSLSEQTPLDRTLAKIRQHRIPSKVLNYTPVGKEMCEDLRLAGSIK
ncbi:hypothetical protein CWI39_1954p0010 [Hamiltosporidium magnivora]|uniref:Uncharacterized protein n=1 Tax=Hamiltosporidium magnivora TaxID=148818 RepID=A0A4Q9KXI2_9MICR|nr:hypothetical protein CWI39_1954p0010 [Hamiltosporidium magnivora]